MFSLFVAEGLYAGQSPLATTMWFDSWYRQPGEIARVHFDLFGTLLAALPDSRAAEKAGVVARDVIEYLDSIDYNKYFESLIKPSARSGDNQKIFLDFSLNSITAAKVTHSHLSHGCPCPQMQKRCAPRRPYARSWSSHVAFRRLFADGLSLDAGQTETVHGADACGSSGSSNATSGSSNLTIWC